MKKQRRESASVVDEFFNEDFSENNVIVNLRLAKYADCRHLRTGLYNNNNNNNLNMDNQHHFIDDLNDSRRESVSIVDEFFGSKREGDENGRLQQKSKPELMELFTNPMETFSMPMQKLSSEPLWSDLTNISSHESSELKVHSHASPVRMVPSPPQATLTPLSSSKPEHQQLHTIVKKEPVDFKATCSFANVSNISQCALKTEPVFDGSERLTPLSTANSVNLNSVIPQPVTLQSPSSLSPSQIVPSASPLSSSGSVPMSVPPYMQTPYAMTTTTTTVIFPPTPPNSQPGSPSNQDFVRRTPPPPYPIILPNPVSIAPATSTSSHCSSLGLKSTPRNTHPGCTTIRYNRKNNPELEKRRIHFCDFPG